MLRDGKEVSIDVVPFDSTQRTYVTKDGTTYKIDDGTSVIYAGVSGIIKGYRIFLGVDNVQVTLEEGDSLTIKDIKYFGGVETVTTVYTTPTNDIDIIYNAVDIQRMNATTGSGFLDITPSDISVSGMTVTIQPQRALVDGITVNAKDAVQIPIDNGLSQLRTDLIVLRKNQTTASADYFVKKGELGSTTPPALEQVAMGIYEIPVCSIRVNANQTTLELSNITDLRFFIYSSTSEANPNTPMSRDEFGRSKIGYPLEDEHIVNFEAQKGVITDTTTLSPKTHGSVRLTESSTTRTLSNGVFAGQEFTIINASGATKTISATTRGNSFQLTSTRIYTKLVWSGTTWLRGMEIPIGTTVWLLTNDNPDTIFGGDWNMVGTKDRALVSGNGTTGNSTGKLPQIDGGFNQANALNYTQGGYPAPYGAFGRATANISGDVAASSQFGKVTTFSANKSNSTKYSTSKTELIKADGTYVNGWTKVAF